MFIKTGKFNKITIRLASNEFILKTSCGEVLKHTTINYRTHKPEIDGLFCERIFGPIKDYECACGKYKRIIYKGITCDKCGVAVVEKKVRRERIGHIHLVVPIVHLWSFRSCPNQIGKILGLSSKILNMIIYYERYIIIQPGLAKKDDGLKILDLLTEEEYFKIRSKLPKENDNLSDNDPRKFIAKIGAESIEYLLNKMNLNDLYDNLKFKYYNEKYKPRRIEYLKRLHLVASFLEAEKHKKIRNDLMIRHVIPVIPPDLRPIVPIEGGKFATSDINELYRRLIIRNNRLKKIIEIQAPEVIIRNEKRMLQEAVDALYENTKTDRNSYGNRVLKSLSSYLKGKKGIFRQNLLGKRVDYSARSVIVVGPQLKLYECGLPKEIASELYKPFIIRKLLSIGQTVQAATKLIEKKHPIIWDLLENIIKGHPILLNRAPTLHRLGIQAFQPKLIEIKSIQLHPLVCTAFNADFDGDQMAVHLPLSNEAILEAKFLMLSSQNILNPANGDPITVPSQDMVLGLYYMTKELKENIKIKGLIFSSTSEVEIAYNENVVSIHTQIKVKVKIIETNYLVSKIISTTVGRVLFNKFIPHQFGYLNNLITKKYLSALIKKIFLLTNVTTTVKFLDEIKELGFDKSFKGGLSFNFLDIIRPVDKEKILNNSIQKIYQVNNNYNLGFITNNERYKKVIYICTKTKNILTEKVRKNMNQLNSISMMLDSGARGSKEQIRQISLMRGLMTKPIKKSVSTTSELLETPILSNFIDGISILEYFISTHGSRKGLADTALKTADAGYLTRRLVDVAQDIIINEKDCGTLSGLTIPYFKKRNYDFFDSFYNRILGRISLQNISNHETKKIIVYYNNMIDEKCASEIDKLGIEQVYVRSTITCESKYGICAKCYGMNLAKGYIVQKGEAVGVIAAQSIGEPGTQLTLRTFHVGETVVNIYEASSHMITQFNGLVEFEQIKFIQYKKMKFVFSSYSYLRILYPEDGFILRNYSLTAGSSLLVTNGEFIKNGTKICWFDLDNYVILSSGIVNYKKIKKGNKIISEYRKNHFKIIDNKGKRHKEYHLPLGYTFNVSEGEYIPIGKLLAKVYKNYEIKIRDITVGLPRVTELCEARNPENPSLISEISGIVQFGKIKKGNREIIIYSKKGEKKTYLVQISKKILVQENDSIQAGTYLSEGSIRPKDILSLNGPNAIQEYLINEIQEVYNLQGVKINEKHFEIIVRKMMRKVKILNSGDTNFLKNSIEYKESFISENEIIKNIKIIEDPGDSYNFEIGQLISVTDSHNENEILISENKKLMKCRNAFPAIAKPILQGITKASLQTKSFISSASFQETTKVLNEAASIGKTDNLLGIKENVVVGNKINAGTGFKEYNNFIISSKK